MGSEQLSVRVLVVDDESIIADSLALVLRSKGFETRVAYSGDEAMEIAAAWNPNLVISDVIMAGTDGVKLAIHLAEALPACKVLLMSGHPDSEELLSQAKQLGHEFPILAKPFSVESLFPFLPPSPETETA